MQIQIIQVPYDSGYKEARQGAGPARFLQHQLDQVLEADGHRVEISQIEAQSDFTTEVVTAFELNRLLAVAVGTAIKAGFFPLVLSGNCNSCLGTMAGIGTARLGVVWFDAHGEFNTPETTLSGFFDGMPLAVATGRCWVSITRTIPNFSPVLDSNVILVGACDLDKAEQRQLEHSDLKCVRTGQLGEAAIRKGIEAALIDLRDRVSGIYLHIDMDVFDVNGGAANHFGASGGLSPDFMVEAVALVKKHVTVRGCGIASYDPAFDPRGTFLEAGMRCIRKIISE